MVTIDPEITRGIGLITDILGQEMTTSPVAEKAAKPRKAIQRAANRTGRSAFVAPVCTDHPDWEDESGHVAIAIDPENPPTERLPGVNYVDHCAKFGHLPGKGKGKWQPPVWRIFVNIGMELVKPLVLIGLLFTGLYGVQWVFSGGLGGIHVPVLQPTNHVRPTACRVPNSSKLPTPNTVRRVGVVPTAGPSSIPRVLPSGKALTKC